MCKKIGYSSRIFCRLLFLCLFKRSIALGLGVGLGLGIGLGFVLGLGLGVGLALGLGWVRHYMLRSESACIKPSFSRRIPKKKTKDGKKFLKISGRTIYFYSEIKKSNFLTTQDNNITLMTTNSNVGQY